MRKRPDCDRRQVASTFSVMPSERAQRSESRNPVAAGPGVGPVLRRDGSACWMPAFAGITMRCVRADWCWSGRSSPLTGRLSRVLKKIFAVIPAERAQRSESRNPVHAGPVAGNPARCDAGEYWVPAFADMP